MLTKLIVTAENGWFAQGKFPWESMDIERIKRRLESNNKIVNVTTFQFLKDNIASLKDYIIIYTSSQRLEHKYYIQDIMFLLKDNNTLIPNYESLLAHENKGFQSLLDKKYNLGLIKSEYYCDICEVKNIKNLNYPLVYKSVNGASSMGVKKVHNIEEMYKYVKQPCSISLELLKRKLKKYIFKSKYNHQWEKYLSFAQQRFIIQGFIPDLQYDFKVLIFGKKYYLLKRFVAENDFKASGSGLHSRNIGSDLKIVLDFARGIKNKFRSHIYSLDICVKNKEPHLIEFQMTHVGPVTLSESDHYFIYNATTNNWEKVFSLSSLEDEFSNAVEEYINESDSYSA